MTSEKGRKLAVPQTTFVKKEETAAMRNWILLNAEGKTLGRLASEVSKILRGKHKPAFTPNADAGDGVVIVNAEKIIVTGTKEARKVYRHHSGWVGGLKEIPYRVMIARKPEFVVRHAVKGMMPKNKISDVQLKRLRVFAGGQHDLAAQRPIAVEI